MRPERAGEWRRGWPLVACAGLGMAGATANFVVLGAMIRPLSAEFGWSRAEIASFGLISVVLQILFGPFIGLLIGRYGARRIALTGALTLPFATACATLVTPSVNSWYLVSALMGAAALPFTSAVWSAAIVANFEARRGLALGLAFSGVGFCNAIVPVVSASVAEAYGWRAAYLCLAGFMLLVILPAMWLFFREPPRSPSSAGDRRPGIAAATAGLTLREALASRRFWTLCLGVFLASGVVGALNVHLQPMLIAGGATAVAAAAMASLYGPAQICARIAGGYLLDRVRGPAVGAMTALLPLVSCLLLLWNAQASSWGALIPLCAGLAAGLELDILAYYVSRYFGQRAYGAICGVSMSLAYSCGFGLTPVALGAVFDASGTYRPGLYAMSIALPAASLLLFSLGRFPAHPLVRARGKNSPQEHVLGGIDG